MVLGDGGAMKSGVKVGFFLKKQPVGSKGGGAGTFMFAKRVHKKIYKYPPYLLSKCFSNLLLGLQIKPNFQNATFFSNTNHGRGSIGGTFTANVSLVPPVSTKIDTHCKTSKILL